MEKVKRKYTPRGDPPSPIPSHIDLPTGRRVMVADIMNKSSGMVTINLRTGVKIKPGEHHSLKYSVEDRRWIVSASIEEIQSKYNMNIKQATALRIHSKGLLRSNNIC